MYYILNGKTPVPCRDTAQWSKVNDADARRVSLTEIAGYSISTVFLGIDHGFSNYGPPVLFETMIFGHEYDDLDMEYQERCSTWEEAEAQHEKAVKFIQDRVDSRA